MIKTLLTLTAATALTLAVCEAQSSSTTTSTTATDAATGASKTTTTTTENSGTISEYTPGSALVLTTGTGPVHYKFGKTVTYVTESGKVVEASKVKKDSKVRVHYVKQGDEMMVDKVIVSGDDD